MDRWMRKYVIMGVQGSGKGTQATMLAGDLDLVHISVGDIFRWHVQNHTKLGAQVRRIMAAGELVDDELVESVVREPARTARLELRVHHRRLPAQPAAGRVLPGELRHRRGDPPRPARRRGAAARPGPAAVLAVRAGLQPDRPPPRAGGSLRRMRRRAGQPRGRHRARRWRPGCATTTRRPSRCWSCSGARSSSSPSTHGRTR